MASDPIKEHEKDIDQWVKEARAIQADLTPRVAPHAIGTTKVSGADARFDWENREADYWPARIDDELKTALANGENIGAAWVKVFLLDKEMNDGTST